MKKYIELLGLLLLFAFFSCESSTEPDTTLPSVSIIFPSADTTLSGSIKILVDIKDNSAVKSAELMVDNVKTGISNKTAPYTLVWNSFSYRDGAHFISVMAYDKSNSNSESDMLRIFIDNSSILPQKVSIANIAYDKNTMTINWYRTKNANFNSYELFHSDAENGIKTMLAQKYNANDTTFTLTEFDPLVENWFWIQVTNIKGYASLGESFLVLEKPPIKPEMYPIVFQNNSFVIKWHQSKEVDFVQYSLYQVPLSDTTNRTLIYSAQTRDDTTYVFTDICDNNFYYFEIAVRDYWELESISELKLASSYLNKIVYLNNGMLSIMENGGSGTKVIFSKYIPEELSYHQFTPGGTPIVFGYVDETTWSGDIYSVNIDGSALENLTHSNDGEWEPDVSPSGTSLIFSKYGEIYNMGIDGSSKNKLTTNTLIEHFPTYSPDGQKIAFVTEAQSEFSHAKLFLMNNDGSSVETLVEGVYLLGSQSFTFSPDGSVILYVAESDLGNLVSIDLDSKVISQINSGLDLLDISTLGFSPDGSKIILSVHGLIYLMNSDGSNLREIASGHDPYFMPDGSAFVFVDDNIYAYSFAENTRILLKEKGAGDYFAQPIVQP